MLSIAFQWSWWSHVLLTLVAWLITSAFALYYQKCSKAKVASNIYNSQMELRLRSLSTIVKLLQRKRFRNFKYLPLKLPWKRILSKFKNKFCATCTFIATKSSHSHIHGPIRSFTVYQPENPHHSQMLCTLMWTFQPLLNNLGLIGLTCWVM